jgi:hypothetical protein
MNEEEKRKLRLPLVKGIVDSLMNCGKMLDSKGVSGEDITSIITSALGVSLNIILIETISVVDSRRKCLDHIVEHIIKHLDD